MSDEAGSQKARKPAPGSSLGVGGWLMILLVMAILWAGSFGGGSKIVEGTPKTENRVMATTVANALEQYFVEHAGRLPPMARTAKEGEDLDSDTSNKEGLVAVLLGKGPEKGADFLDGFKQAKADAKTTTGWKNGLVYVDGHYSVVDWHGNYFRVRLDAGADGYLANPNTDQVEQGKTRLKKRVILWSAGKDGRWDTWDDNAMTWE